MKGIKRGFRKFRRLRFVTQILFTIPPLLIGALMLNAIIGIATLVVSNDVWALLPRGSLWPMIFVMFVMSQIANFRLRNEPALAGASEEAETLDGLNAE